MRKRWLDSLVPGVCALVVLACAGEDLGRGGQPPGAGAPSAPPGANDPPPTDPGELVAVAVESSALSTVTSAVEEARRHDAASLAAAHNVAFEPVEPRDPSDIVGLDLIQGSAITLDDAELALLGDNGFVILRRKHYPSFPYGYFEIYGDDLPVYVSADMVLEAVHRSYDDILKAVELVGLIPRLDDLLTAMRARLGSGDAALAETTRQDADFYLSVALGLLRGVSVAAVGGADTSAIAEFVESAEKAAGEQRRELFGTPRRIDFSQFKPRGHYEDDPRLQRYFRAMMWMGRIDFRLIETQEDGTQVFRRRQLEAALALRALLDETGLQAWRAVDRTITAFVGEHDYMTVPEIDKLLSTLGRTPEAGLGDAPDQVVAQAIIDGQYGAQRIASHIMRKAPGAEGTLPLSASFAFFGQRYTVDSHVFSNVVYDRVDTRVLPDPLDAAFAALGNDQAVALLSDELTEHPYAPDLSAMRVLVDAHPDEYWQGSLYTQWLGALRTLSPGADGAGPSASGLPLVARTEPWGRRLLSTQLASWAELRHDTILYVKQSYTVGTECEFPDAYVEPYPEFFRTIARFAEMGQATVDGLVLTGTEGSSLASSIRNYFSTLASVTSTLGDMAELQRTGEPHTTEHVAFINQAIRVEGGGSGDPWQTGWYKDLFFNPSEGLKFDPTIADVHTDVGGDVPIARGPSVLHVGTGLPRPMVVTVDTCQGPRAYAGIVFAYHEHLEPSLNRLTDNDWQQRLQEADGAEDVPWLLPVLGPE